MSVFLYLPGSFGLTEQLKPESPLVPGLWMSQPELGVLPSPNAS